MYADPYFVGVDADILPSTERIRSDNLIHDNKQLLDTLIETQVFTALKEERSESGGI